MPWLLAWLDRRIDARIAEALRVQREADKLAVYTAWTAAGDQHRRAMDSFRRAPKPSADADYSVTVGPIVYTGPLIPR
jgi:hypothetical protein